MERYATLTTEVRFAGSLRFGGLHGRRYMAGCKIQVCSPLVHDGVFLARFPFGEETYIAAYRVDNPPRREGEE